MARRHKAPELLPKVRRNPNAEPAERHRCHVCEVVGTGRVRAFEGRETDRYICPACLEQLGQLPLC